jgi:hypothetical protein
MNPLDSSRADDRQVWLAGYADGELGEKARQQVDAWLAECPQAADALRDQQQLSPVNQEFWKTVAPPEPTHETWAEVGNRIAKAVLPASRPRRPPLHWGALFGSVAATLMVAWFMYNTMTPWSGTPLPRTQLPADENVDPLAEFTVLPIADPSEVDILVVRGRHPDRFLVGDNPLPDVLTLVGPDDITLDAGADVDVSDVPGGVPMIFPRQR